MNVGSWSILQAAAGPYLGWVVGCRSTGSCALVNPTLEAVPELVRRAVEHRFTVRFVLHGRSPTAPIHLCPAPLTEDRDAPIAARRPATVLTVAPDPSVARPNRAHDAVLLTAGGRRVGVRRHAGLANERGPWFTIGTAAGGRRTPAHVAGRARLAVGAGFVDVLPIAPDELVFRIPGHLFVSCTATGTPAVLLDNPPETLIHPSVLADGLFVSSVAQEAYRRSLPLATQAPSDPALETGTATESHTSPVS